MYTYVYISLCTPVASRARAGPGAAQFMGPRGGYRISWKGGGRHSQAPPPLDIVRVTPSTFQGGFSIGTNSRGGDHPCHPPPGSATAPPPPAYPSPAHENLPKSFFRWAPPYQNPGSPTDFLLKKKLARAPGTSPPAPPLSTPLMYTQTDTYIYINIHTWPTDVSTLHSCCLYTMTLLLMTGPAVGVACGPAVLHRVRVGHQWGGTDSSAAFLHPPGQTPGWRDCPTVAPGHHQGKRPSTPPVTSSRTNNESVDLCMCATFSLTDSAILKAPVIKRNQWF